MNTSEIPQLREDLRSFKFSSQALDDFIELGLSFMQNKAIGSVVGNVSDFIFQIRNVQWSYIVLNTISDT